MHYLDHTASVSERVEDLLGRMTLQEKCGQLNQRLYGWETFRRTGDDTFVLTEKFYQEVERFAGIGALYGLFRADPWSKMNARTGISRANSAKVANMLQRYVMENTRLGIPVLFSEELPHGHQALESECYPVNLARGASFNPELQRQVAEAMAAEVASKGVHLALVSALDILRDPRWGRSEECFGEDPYLAARLTEAVTAGIEQADRMAVVLKHFAAQGEPVGGHNSGPVSIGERELREIFLPGIQAGIAAGAGGLMAAYNEIDGVPCHANRALLTDILRDEFQFDGVVMADGCALDRLLGLTGDARVAAGLAAEAGVDLSLWDEIYPVLEEAVEAGIVAESVIDQAVRRVLTLKFKLGLFESPYVNEVVPTPDPAWREVNLQAAREGICLLENRGKTLPIGSNVKKLAVIGPNADALYNQLGDYTAPQDESAGGLSVLAGIRKMAPADVAIHYEQGSDVREAVPGGLDRAVAVAEDADAVVLVLGGSSARNFDMDFLKNGAVSSKGPNMDAGENVDVANLCLPAAQRALFKAVRKTGRPLIVVLIQGRPLAIPEISEATDALLTAWYPGAVGGQAVAEVLFGQYNPSGKLPVSIPRSSGQLPVYYNQKAVEYKEDYFDGTGKPLYPFGYGLSYSDFQYVAIQTDRAEYDLAALAAGMQTVEVAVTLQNRSNVAGEEVIQLYLFDQEASITRRKRELKGFRKIKLAPHEERTITLSLTANELEIWSIRRCYEIEAGTFQLYAGGNSETELRTQFHVK
ncbi:glycoside hydrolase family 3 N-terminal domain-containing protein [Listeria costaricensis]|uniref:glycoside hydrolase family 3 N-terminal domain-containing protein n=1 Tax=Listeria costaricensis TaxID=2026604 RepID=UPI000C089379|nr:glycoside hydrolase family 3 N-terminal domain-containing protein [Listeria costaricensis]